MIPLLNVKIPYDSLAECEIKWLRPATAAAVHQSGSRLLSKKARAQSSVQRSRGQTCPQKEATENGLQNGNSFSETKINRFKDSQFSSILINFQAKPNLTQNRGGSTVKELQFFSTWSLKNNTQCLASHNRWPVCRIMEFACLIIFD